MKKKTLLLAAIVAAWMVFGIIALVFWKLGDEASVKSWIVSSLVTNFLVLYFHYQTNRSKGESLQNAQMTLKRRSGMSLVGGIIAIWAFMGVINFVSWKLGDEHPVKDWIHFSMVFTILAVYLHLASYCSQGKEH